MFSIAAINDTNSTEQWEPLAPTKEAQEFHLTQAYHEGLLKLQAKEYDKARELLHSVLKDPLISGAQADGKTSDGHLLQLRFLALKNLAAVFLQQGSVHYENALHCYLQAVEIDTKDSVIWNQLGTLSCSMGLLSISRWAFEQGLLCSPNNWNCMEKLLEVLIAIGDEVACLSVAELILRHWPSHSRAFHVKQTIEESDPIPFAPRGIDKLEPKHARLKFLDKRKAADEIADKGIARKIPNNNIELQLQEVSWVALTDVLLEMLLSLKECTSNMDTEKVYRSANVRLALCLPFSLDVVGSIEKRGLNSVPSSERMPPSDSYSGKPGIVKESEPSFLYEQPHERRSTRLERLRSRKPGKEELDFATSKDVEKVVLQFLENFTVGGPRNRDSDHATGHSASCINPEYHDVSLFIQETSKNYGAYHMGHLLLEWAATKGLICEDTISKLPELERLTRNWGQDRTPECCLFLAELYYDLGSFPSNASKFTEFMSEASYHLCKIIESVALDYPFHLTHVFGSECCSSVNSSQNDKRSLTVGFSCQDLSFDSSLLTSKSSFWVRYFWLSGKLSIVDGNKAKAYEEYCISLSLLAKKEKPNDSPSTISLPHLKVNKELTINRILYEINLLKLDFLLEKTIGEMIEKEMYEECIKLVAPLLLSTQHVYINALPLPAADEKGEGFTCIELSALNILIKACEKAKPMDFEVYLNCYQRKLKIVMVLAGVEDCKPFHKKLERKASPATDTVSKESPDRHSKDLVVEEVKAISHCVAKLKNYQSVNSNEDMIPIGTIGDTQSLLLAIMCHVATNYLSKKSSAAIANENEQKERCCFVDAAIAFCKLQHLVTTVSVKTQVELIVAIHELLAEYGICCAGKGCDGEEGTFLKFAIKHLFTLDMKLKSNLNFSSGELQSDNQPSHHSHSKTSKNDLISDKKDGEISGTGDEINAVENDGLGGIRTKGITTHGSDEKSNKDEECEEQCHDEDKNREGKGTEQHIECGIELTGDEREELELIIDNSLDQCFFCLYGLNLRSDSSYDEDLAMHKNTSRGEYQTKEQCADVFQYILPYAKDSSRTGLVKLRRVLRAIRKHFPQPPEDILTGNAIDKFLDNPELCENNLSEEAGSEGYLETITKIIFPDAGSFKQHRALMIGSSEPHSDVYCNLYYYLALSEEMSATDKWPGFVLTKEGEDFVQQNANLFKYDLLYNPLRFESWQRLANIYDEEVDLLLNDGSKHINVVGWKKNSVLPQRVEASRRRSRRCLLMSLALAKTSVQQCEIHQLLALVYYDSLQNVVPFYDQQSLVPSKDTVWITHCENSLEHFKKAFSYKQDWLHAFYMGKLCEKLGYSYETSLSYYDRAISLNPSAVDPVYRMHTSRLKLLWTCGKQNLEALKVIAGYSFSQSIKEKVTKIFSELASEMSRLPEDMKDGSFQKNSEEKHKELIHLEELWDVLYSDCLSALEACIEGDLKHFHKARHMLAQGLYRRGLPGDLERSKDELSFCFKSSRSSFTINMWEIDGMVKKGKRKTSGFTGNKKALEVNLPESSRKFITCIRKYLLFYLKLLEETGDICTLDRAFISLRADKRFSLCIEDLVPLALGRFIKSLMSSIHQVEAVSSGVPSSSEHQLEKLFSLFMEQGNLWPEVLSLPEIRSTEVSESNVYGYLHQYIKSLERSGKLEMLEAINEKIRKRFKNPKLSNSNCAKVCRHASVAWCRSLIISLALVTPLQSGLPGEIQASNPLDSGLEGTHLLFIDLQTSELWSSSFEDSTHWENFETNWGPVLTKIKNVLIKKVSDENLETANSLLRCSYNFYRETSCVMPSSGIRLYLVPSILALERQVQPGLDGVELLDLSIPRKLLLWAYTLLYGHYASISAVVKHCEENVKPKMKKGAAASSVPSTTNVSTATGVHTGGGKDFVAHGGGSEPDNSPVTVAASATLFAGENPQHIDTSPSSGESQKCSVTSSQSSHSNNIIAAMHSTVHEGQDLNRS